MEDNRLIAEFMGWKEVKPNLFHLEENYLLNTTTTVCELANLRFKTSWDWLIPVVDRMYDKFDEMYLETTEEFRMELHEQLLDINIEKLYEVLVKFIKWYNGR